MKKYFKVLMFCYLVISTGFFPIAQKDLPHKQTIRVLKGDNLWNLSKRIYGSGFDYPKLWRNQLDSNISQDPNLIYPNMEFYIFNEDDTTRTSHIDSTNSANYYDIRDDITKIRNATISIDKNIKLLPKQTNSPDYEDLWSYLFVIGTGLFVAVVSYFITSWINKHSSKKDRNEQTNL